MRITFLSPTADMSGGGRVIHTYATLLQARGHDVRLVTALPAKPPLRRRLRALLRGRGWWRPGVSHFDGATYPVHRLERGRPIRADDVPDADVVIATWWETAEWMRAFPAARGRHVHFVQGYDAYTPAMKPGVDAVLRLPVFKITISGWLDDMMRRDFGNARTALVPNGVDMAQFHAPPRGRGAVPTVGMVYSTSAVKDSATGLRAIALLRARRPDLRFVSFGSGAPTPETPLPPNTDFTRLPPQDGIRDIYARCDAWLCSSIQEGFGLPVLEAMACGCPIVSTKIGGPLDFLEEGGNGFLVDAGDAEAMADRLGRILDLPDADWRRMSSAARATAARYNWDDAVVRFEAALEEAARG